MKKLYRNQKGSITLEAAIIMPVFIFFLVFLIILIRFAVIDIALNQAVTETTKQISTQAYPIERVIGGVGEYLGENEHVQDLQTEILEAKEELERAIGEDEFNEQFVQPAKAAGESAVQFLGGMALKPILIKHLETASELNIIDTDRVEVTIEDIPKESEGYFIGVVAEYEFDISMPFMTKTFTIRKKAYERLWLGS